MPARVAACLRSTGALALLALLAACGPGDAPSGAGSATGGDSGRSLEEQPAAPLSELRLSRVGRSDDLLCALAPAAVEGALGLAASAPYACECGHPTTTCRQVDVRDDRRRSILVPPGGTLRTTIVPAGARELRFAVASLGQSPTVLDVRLRVLDPTARRARGWQRRMRLADRWAEGSIDLSFLGGDQAVIEVRVAPGPKAQADSVVAVAAPRLVVPAAPAERSASGGHAVSAVLAGEQPVAAELAERPTRAPSGAGSAPAPAVSNIVVYLIDTLRADHTSAYGYARPTTPRLEELARSGVLFENAFSVAGWTRPATASLLTSLYPGVHGVHTESGLSEGMVTLAERLRAAGWSTWAFVANVQVFGPGLGFEQGFDRFVALPGKHAGQVPRTEEVNALLEPQLDELGDEPFFLYVHTIDPHAPYDPPPGWRGRFGDPTHAGPLAPRDTFAVNLRQHAPSAADVAWVSDLYDEDILYQDEMLGVLLDGLARRGLDRSTLVVVLSDHGEELFEHGDWEHGDRLFEPLIRIPLVVRVPGVAPLAGRRVAAPVQIVDVMPTLLRWYGLPGVDACQGRDLTERIEAAPDAQRRPIYCEEAHPDEAHDLASLTEGRWKIIRRRRAGGAASDMLFDLARDPEERRDLAGTLGARHAMMARRLEAHARSLVEPFGQLPDAPRVRLDDATRRQLEALGYLQPGAAPDGADLSTCPAPDSPTCGSSGR